MSSHTWQEIWTQISHSLNVYSVFFDNYQIFNKYQSYRIPILCKYQYYTNSFKIVEEGTFLNVFYKANFLSYGCKTKRIQENYRSISLMNTDEKCSTKCQKALFGNLLKEIYGKTKWDLFPESTVSLTHENQSM